MITVYTGSNILIDDFYCHGGHGLSISVGFSNDSFALNMLSNVIFRNSHLEGGENGIHIKTHVDSSKGLMQNITYMNVTFNRKCVITYGSLSFKSFIYNKHTPSMCETFTILSYKYLQV